MKVLVTGATGFVGRYLVRRLLSEGSSVKVLSRDPARAQGAFGKRVETAAWGEGLASVMEGMDAAVHLAGQSIVGKWTDETKVDLRKSRIETTMQLVEAMATAEQRPGILVSASAVGFYGDRGDETLTEKSSPGVGFLADLCQEWETAALSAAALGVRTICLRLGVVLGKDGGALEKMLPAFKAFAGGPIGSGSQWMSWIHIEDVAGLIRMALREDGMVGPINATAPLPATNKEFSATLARVLGRPSWLPVPAPALKLLYGEGASVLLEGQRVLPEKAMDLGYRFRYPSLEEALRASLE
jgi:uncharacterized protein (TIGR01777 family)